MDHRTNCRYYRANSVLNTDESHHVQSSYSLHSFNNEEHSGQHNTFHAEREGPILAQSIAGEQHYSRQNRSATVQYTDNIGHTYHQAYYGQQRPTHAETSQPSLALSRSGLLSNSHQSTSFDSGFVDLSQDGTDYPAARPSCTIQASQGSRSCAAAEHQVISESLYSIADVETVSWQSKTDDLIDSLLRSRPAYRRRVPPAVLPRDVYKAPQLVQPAAHTATNNDSCSSSESNKGGSHIETHCSNNDHDRSESQSNCTRSPATSRYDADDENTARSSETAVIVYTKKGFVDRYRGHDSYESDFEDDSEEGHRDDGQLGTWTPADWQSLSSFSYKGGTQMGLADCLVVRGYVINEADRDALKLDLSWVDIANPTPRQRITRPATVTIRRGRPIATTTPDPISTTASKGGGRIRRFFKRIRKLFSCCLSGNAEE